MPGDGTRTAITSARPTARCLDLTRLISRVGRGPDTGVDRVERAYLAELLRRDDPLFGLARTSLGFVLLDRGGVAEIARRLSGEAEWGRSDLIGILSRRATPAKRRAQADLRRLALARCRGGRLAAMLRRHLPDGVVYLNVGHSNLRAEVMAAWRALPGGRISVLIHDTIPLDFPEFQRPGTPELFRAKLALVADLADLVIYNSAATQADTERWFQQFGRSPPGVVAHLGVDMPMPDPADLPRDLDLSQPYFLCVGTIEPRKNHALLLDVWESLAQQPDTQIPHLIIVGARGWQNESVFQRLDRSPVMNRWVFERAGLGDAALAALMQRACGLLCPSLAEGFGLPPVEAAALGVTVICPRLPVYKEILGNIPVYAESGDVYSWKQSILRLTEEKRAGHDKAAGKILWSGIPNWADHFNLVLKVT
jgi:glycosyltransferase involved in cell wall biosynthesis